MSEYIDRQAVLDELDEDIEEFVECDYALKTAKKYIKKIPSADVRPVVRGRWKPRDLRYGRSHYFCSACEMTVDMPTAMGIPMFRYCPYCTAGPT